MNIVWQGMKLDTNDMISVPGRIGTTFGVYVTHDHTHVFAAFMYQCEGIKISEVTDEMLCMMADATENADLLKAAGRWRTNEPKKSVG